MPVTHTIDKTWGWFSLRWYSLSLELAEAYERAVRSKSARGSAAKDSDTVKRHPELWCISPFSINAMSAVETFFGVNAAAVVSDSYARI